MKLYSFIYERDSYHRDGGRRKIFYQSFNEDELKKIRQKLIIKCNYLHGFNSVGEIESFEINIETGVWAT